MFALSELPEHETGGHGVGVEGTRRRRAGRPAGTLRRPPPRRLADATRPRRAGPAAGVYRRRRIAVAVVLGLAVGLVVAFASGASAASVLDGVVGAGMLVGWVTAALALARWDRGRPSPRRSGPSESCLSLGPAPSLTT